MMIEWLRGQVQSVSLVAHTCFVLGVLILLSGVAYGMFGRRFHSKSAGSTTFEFPGGLSVGTTNLSIAIAGIGVVLLVISAGLQSISRTNDSIGPQSRFIEAPDCTGHRNKKINVRLVPVPGREYQNFANALRQYCFSVTVEKYKGNTLDQMSPGVTYLIPGENIVNQGAIITDRVLELITEAAKRSLEAKYAVDHPRDGSRSPGIWRGGKGNFDDGILIYLF